MKKVLMTFCAALALSAQAEERLASYGWAEIAGSGTRLPGEVLTVDGRSALLVRNTNDTALQVRLLTISNPPITSTYYALRGEIRYADVHGDGFLEMWNVFPPAKKGGAEAKFFSRTLGESGDMGKISGTSDWRPFLLPFDWSGGRASSSGARVATLDPPSALEVNLVLPGRGEVYLGPLELVEFPQGFPRIGGTTSGWWSDSTGGVIGGIIGAVFGTLAGLTAWLASKGRARGFVTIANWGMICVGAALSVAGITAILMGQPYGVWFPLLLGGILIVAILPGRLRGFQRLYEEQELRRMGAEDVM